MPVFRAGEHGGVAERQTADTGYRPTGEEPDISSTPGGPIKFSHESDPVGLEVQILPPPPSICAFCEMEIKQDRPIVKYHGKDWHLECAWAMLDG